MVDRRRSHRRSRRRRGHLVRHPSVWRSDDRGRNHHHRADGGHGDYQSDGGCDRYDRAGHAGQSQFRRLRQGGRSRCRPRTGGHLGADLGHGRPDSAQRLVGTGSGDPGQRSGATGDRPGHSGHRHSDRARRGQHRLGPEPGHQCADGGDRRRSTVDHGRHCGIGQPDCGPASQRIFFLVGGLEYFGRRQRAVLIWRRIRIRRFRCRRFGRRIVLVERIEFFLGVVRSDCGGVDRLVHRERIGLQHWRVAAGRRRSSHHHPVRVDQAGLRDGWDDRPPGHHHIGCVVVPGSGRRDRESDGAVRRNQRQRVDHRQATPGGRRGPDYCDHLYGRHDGSRPRCGWQEGRPGRDHRDRGRRPDPDRQRAVSGPADLRDHRVLPGPAG